MPHSRKALGTVEKNQKTLRGILNRNANDENPRKLLTAHTKVIIILSHERQYLENIRDRVEAELIDQTILEGMIKMQEKKNILTYEGLRKYEDELHELKVVRRQEVAQKIKEAREQGDLSENAEYDAAKDEQRDIEARIEELEKILKNAEVVVEDEVDLKKINIGCSVKILDLEFSEELTYKIVGSTEANSLKGKISNESPVGKALIGHKVGDTVEVETQAGVFTYKVLGITRSN